MKKEEMKFKIIRTVKCKECGKGIGKQVWFMGADSEKALKKVIKKGFIIQEMETC